MPINEDVRLRESPRVRILENAVECFAYPFQVSVDHPIRVEIVEATCDAKQLNIDDEDRSTHGRTAGKLTRPMRLTWLPRVLTYCNILPLSIHFEIMQNSNSPGATPSTLKIFLCLARLQMTTSLQYFWGKASVRNTDGPSGGPDVPFCRF